ncbi:KAP family P-loop NTPase fold protein [Vibrio diabolicus]|uniref:KAP family P-loop NTPase fold protein n=1 Tax=Vibrio diabolicus TaxID=50719 RepID=UPI00216032D4|nr:KAP family NTPase [Vibrio diabolicus]MCS0401501.1 KAP family NTPase [Vibrio diabolicus]
MRINKIKHHDWLKDYTFDNCLLNRKEYGEFITNYITEESDGFVLNLNGSWGTGKTHFLKRLYTQLNNLGHPTIYIDAWESDFTKDPLTVVSSELLSQLEKYAALNGKDLDNVKKLLGKFIKGAAIATSGYVSKKFLGEGAIGIETVKQLFEKTDADYINSVKKGYLEQVNAIKEIRTKLSLLGEVLKSNSGQKLPIVVLVDELDRCRPDYAIEMLEVIKHFFDTSNFVFVVATDTEQLCCSIKAVYGKDFNSEKYIKRFFHRKAQLPFPNIKQYLLSHGIDSKFEERFENVILVPNSHQCDISISRQIEWVARAYGLDIRTLDQLIAKFIACLRTANNSSKRQVINTSTLLIALVEFDLNAIEYTKRQQDNEGQLVHCKPMYSFEITMSGAKTDVKNFFKLVIDATSRTLKEEDRGFRGAVMTMQPMYPDEVFAYAESDPAFQGVVNNLVNALQYYAYGHQDDTPKYWFWDDYKHVVELAGNIE